MTIHLAARQICGPNDIFLLLYCKRIKLWYMFVFKIETCHSYRYFKWMWVGGNECFVLFIYIFNIFESASFMTSKKEIIALFIPLLSYWTTYNNFRLFHWNVQKFVKHHAKRLHKDLCYFGHVPWLKDGISQDLTVDASCVPFVILQSWAVIAFVTWHLSTVLSCSHIHGYLEKQPSK